MAAPAVAVSASPRTRFGSLAAFCLAGAFALFVAALLSDWAYWRTYEIQWSNFAAWLLVGAMVLGAIALLHAIVRLAAQRGRRSGLPLYALALGAGWVLGLFNSLMHTRDAWAVMPWALVLSILTAVCVAVAVFLAFFAPRSGEVP